MDNTRIHDAENVEDRVVENAVITAPAPRPTRGRPPGRNRRENPLNDGLNSSDFDEERDKVPSDDQLRINGRVGRARRSRLASSRVNNDKPIFTLSVAAEILHLHPRTLRIYEEHDLVVPTRTQTNRRRYSQNDIKKFQFIQYLTRERGVNLSGVKIILALLEELRKTIPDPITQMFPDYGESENFPFI